MDHTKNKSDSPRFQVGNKVRVRQGFMTQFSPRPPWAAGRGRSPRYRAMKTR